jgi:hypothetical protein
MKHATRRDAERGEVTEYLHPPVASRPHEEVYRVPYYLYDLLLWLLALGNLDLRGSDGTFAAGAQPRPPSAPSCAIYENKRAPSRRHAWQPLTGSVAIT